MKSTQAVLQDKDRALEHALHVSFELGNTTWTLTFSNGQRGPSRFTVAAGDQAAVLQSIARAKARCGLPPDAPVYSCYEAGRDGWWLHRWLNEQGIHNIVVDSSSIEVNRRARRAKSDRLDGIKLLAMLLRYRAGEPRLWSLVHEPSPEAEDQRRLHRELQRLGREHTARCGACTTCAPRTWATAPGSHGGPLIRTRCRRSCARRSSASCSAWRWSSSSCMPSTRNATASWRSSVIHWSISLPACAPSASR